MTSQTRLPRRDATSSPPPGLLPLFRSLAEHGRVLEIEELREHLSAWPLSPDDLGEAIQIDTGAYVRTLVFENEYVEVLVMAWLPGQRSPIHDHAGSACAVRVVTGRAAERIYSIGADGLATAIEDRHYAPGSVVCSFDRDVHSLGNAVAGPASPRDILVTVHVYSPPLQPTRKYAESRGGSLKAEASPVVIARPMPRNPAVALSAKRLSSSAPTGVRSAPRAAPAHRIAIIGGGYCGIMTAAETLRQWRSPVPPRITIYDRSGRFGAGPAYTADSPHLLLNVPAERMGAWAESPKDFVAWAGARGRPIEPGAFAPRSWYREYLNDILRDAQARAATLGGELIQLSAGVRDLCVRGDNPVELLTDEAEPEIADTVVLAIGIGPTTGAHSSHGKANRDRIVTDPWRPGALAAIKADDTVALIGTGLTALDVLLSLESHGVRGRITALSPRGWLPRPHRPFPADTCPAAASLRPDTSTPRSLLRWTRRAVTDVESAGGHWTHVFDVLRQHAQEAWQRWPVEHKAQFLRHLRLIWDVHRHRTPPEGSACVQRLCDSGQLTIIAATALDWQAHHAGVELHLRPRGQNRTQTLAVNRLILCTGPSSDVTRWGDALIDSMLTAGLATTDALALGLRSDPEGRLIDAHGHAHSRLYVIGSLRRADLWECTAIPDLREHARELGERLAVISHATARAPAER